MSWIGTTSSPRGTSSAGIAQTAVVFINPDGIEIVSYPGPDASIRVESLNGDKIVARRYRNRRIGEFLRELGLTEGRCTGIPTIREAMAKNGSPPKFSTDPGRTYFLVELPVRPRMEGVGRAHEELSATEVSVLRFVANRSRNRREIGEHLGLKGRSGHFYKVIDSPRSLGFIELTIPDKPQSKNSRMRITRQGRAWLESQGQQLRAASETKGASKDR